VRRDSLAVEAEAAASAWANASLRTSSWEIVKPQPMRLAIRKAEAKLPLDQRQLQPSVVAAVDE
jgi:hypothetical protein